MFSRRERCALSTLFVIGTVCGLWLNTALHPVSASSSEGSLQIDAMAQGSGSADRFAIVKQNGQLACRAPRAGEGQMLRGRDEFVPLRELAPRTRGAAEQTPGGLQITLRST